MQSPRRKDSKEGRKTSLDLPRRTSLDGGSKSPRKSQDLSPRQSGNISPRNHPALMSFLNAQFISLNLPQHETFAVKSSESGLRTLNWLLEKHVLGCPVCDDSDNNEVLGLVDVIDLATYAVLKSTKEQSFTQVLEHVKVKELTNYSGQNNLCILPISTSFGEVLKTMSKPGVHRVCIKNPKPNVVEKKLGFTSVPWLSKFVTQSLIIGFLADNLDVFGNIMDATVSSSGVGTESVYSVTTDSSLEDAFRLMVSKKVSGLAVLDSHQHFVGNIDARELAGLLLGTPAVDAKSKVGAHVKTGVDNLVVTSNASLGEVIQSLKKSHLHRVYVVDAFSPTSVVGLADVLRYLSKMCPLMLTEADKRTTQAERKINKAYTYKLSKSYKDLCRHPKEIIALEPHTPSFDAFQIFAHEGVLSFPVVEKNKHLKGLVDISDMAAFMLEKFEAGNKNANFDEELKQEMLNTPIVKLMNYSGTNLCCPQSQDVKVRELFHVLSRPGVHRVPLINQLAEKFRLKHVEGFVTQTDAINFVASHIPFFGYQVLSRKIQAIPEFGNKLYTVTESDTVLDAFKLLRKERLDGVPVVDANGLLSATISFRDFRFMLAVDNKVLHLSTDLLAPLSVFTKKTKKVNEGFTSSGKKIDAFTPAVPVRPTQTILDVIHMFQQHRTHRVYLIDEQTSKPTKCITLGCVLHYLASTLPYLDALTDKERLKRGDTIQKQISAHHKDELALSSS